MDEEKNFPHGEERTEEETILKAEPEEECEVAASPSLNAEESTVEVAEDTEKTGNSWLKELRDWVVAIAIAVVVALLVRNFVFTLVKVQGESMEPTLQNADRLYVNRLFYTPKKGDVIIFIPESDPKRPYVKRIIATEGDTLYIDFGTGEVFVNNQLIQEPYIREKTRLAGSYMMDLIFEGEYGPDKPIVIEEGHVFAMGDNRNNSKDSREIGQIPVEEILGNAVFRFWPVQNIGSVHRDAIATSDGLYENIYNLD